MHRRVHLGLEIRRAQLAKWIERVRKRLGDLSRHPEQHFPTHASSLILKESRDRLDRADKRLLDADKSLKIASDFELRTARGELLDAEAFASPVDWVFIPALRSRTPSDPRYEAFIERLLRELGFGRVSVLSTHFACIGSPLEVAHHSDGVPLFLFSPANRSFLTMSLLYHEIGHWAYWDVLDPGERNKLSEEIRLFAGNRAETTKDAVEEIAADVFAGLVGGYTYTSSFCCFLLGQHPLQTTRNRKYPSPEMRVQIARWASEYAEDPDAKLADPIFSAWDYFVAESRSIEDGTDALIEFEAVKDFTMRYTEFLVNRRIRLANTRTPRLRHTKKGRGIDDLRTCPVPTILREACRFRAEADTDSYWAWELDAVANLRLAD